MMLSSLISSQYEPFPPNALGPNANMTRLTEPFDNVSSMQGGEQGEE